MIGAGGKDRQEAPRAALPGIAMYRFGHTGTGDDRPGEDTVGRSLVAADLRRWRSRVGFTGGFRQSDRAACGGKITVEPLGANNFTL
jgi:hypothetical protein